MKNSQSKTKLTEHQFTGKKLIPPFATIDFTPSSWINDRLPDMLWAVLLTRAFSRPDVLKRFSVIVDTACAITDTGDPDWRTKPLVVTLSGIAHLTDVEKQKEIMSIIAQDSEAKHALAPMLLLDTLPAKDLWSSIIKVEPTPQHWVKLAGAISGCFDHQS